MSISSFSSVRGANIDSLDHARLAPAPAAPAANAAATSAEAEGAAAAGRIGDILAGASETTDARLARLAVIQAAQNRLLEAAQPLLLTLARLPDMSLGSEEHVAAFHALLVREVQVFQQLCTQASLPRDSVIAASYALCTALDEAANGTSWGGGVADMDEADTAPVGVASAHASGAVGVWAGQMLAAFFHDDTAGGIKVFRMIGRLMTNQPEEHIDLLELLHRILSIGFQGKYRSLPDGRRQHETIRQRIHAVLSQARGAVPLALSPHWQGAGAGRLRLLRSVPVWMTAVVLGLAAFGLFAWYKYQLMKQTDALVTEITAIGKMTPPPVVVAPLRLATLLKDEIAQGRVAVEEDSQHSRVVLRGDDMFVPGQASINPAIRHLLDKVAAEIARVPGAVQVIGHSDNQPIRTRRFPNNQVLSEERATLVADALQAAGVAAGRIEIRGAGDSVPIADNVTAAGRARNRRVEIHVSAAPVAATARAGVIASAQP